MKAIEKLAAKLDHKYGWDKLPKPAGLLALIGLRQTLREENLYDTGRGPLDKPDVDDHPRLHDRAHARRHLQRPGRPADGQPRQPLRAQRAAREHLAETAERMIEPSPRPISRELLTRDEFIPATTLNLLAGAWIQFEVHDWFSHGKNETENPWEIPLAGRRLAGHPMRIERTRRDPSAEPSGPPTFVTDDTPLVGRLADLRPRPRVRDGDALGRARQAAARRRTGCRRREIEANVDLTGVAGNFWVGLALLHTLFMREHNTVCDQLARGRTRSSPTTSSTTRRGSSSRR